uniref:Uncharacterized protein n=1 Tax=Anguilla anguilla TaxID=7936 RepID=A0A0E9VMR4_ANGAN
MQFVFLIKYECHATRILFLCFLMSDVYKIFPFGVAHFKRAPILITEQLYVIYTHTR